MSNRYLPQTIEDRQFRALQQHAGLIPERYEIHLLSTMPIYSRSYNFSLSFLSCRSP
jgi:hypothetical protein